jgi:hypothetical protein
MMGSGVWAGQVPLENAYNLKSVIGDKETLKSELERIGYLGSTPASYKSMPMAAHFELHIEQGPILEAEEKKIGVVQGVQAYKWFTVDVEGRGKLYKHFLPLYTTLGTTIYKPPAYIYTYVCICVYKN